MTNVTVNLNPFMANLSNSQNLRYILATAIENDAEQFVPFLSGQLAGSAVILETPTTTKLVYDKIYALYLYNALVMDYPGHVKGPHKKVAEPKKNLNFTRTQHPKASGHWIDQAYLMYGNLWANKIMRGILS